MKYSRPVKICITSYALGCTYKKTGITLAQKLPTVIAARKAERCILTGTDNSKVWFRTVDKGGAGF